MARKISWIWYEMARRKKTFHNEEDWVTIRLWGLFRWEDVSRYIKSGALLTDMKKENKIVWVRPSEKAWTTKIKPLVENCSLSELDKKSGWMS
ncbi:MAG: hypothetical protein M0R03_20730 [Novosphingobium sp.]|nr:hypothetical protein [Novosphingobium sp.]